MIIEKILPLEKYAKKHPRRWKSSTQVLVWLGPIYLIMMALTILNTLAYTGTWLGTIGLIITWGGLIFFGWLIWRTWQLERSKHGH